MPFVARRSRRTHDYATETMRPFAVYGTLRPPMRNYECYLGGQTVSERRGVVRDQALYVAGLPYVIDQPGGEVVVDVMTIRPGLYAEVLQRVDHLEGYNPAYPDSGHYRRVARVVLLDIPGGGTAEVTCWLYVAGDDTAQWLIGRAPIVRDYVAYMTADRATRALCAHATVDRTVAEGTDDATVWDDGQKGEQLWEKNGAFGATTRP